VFFAGRYRYRKARVLLAGLLALLIGIAVAAWFGADLLRLKRSLGVVFSLLMLGVFCALNLLIGLRLLRRWFIGATLHLEITEAGVSYGGRTFPWPEIKWIGGRLSAGRMQLALKSADNVREWPLLVDEPLTVDRYDALVMELSAALRDKAPHVKVG
jgi:hypothetical protein